MRKRLPEPGDAAGQPAPLKVLESGGGSCKTPLQGYRLMEPPDGDTGPGRRLGSVARHTASRCSPLLHCFGSRREREEAGGGRSPTDDLWTALADKKQAPLVTDSGSTIGRGPVLVTPPGLCSCEVERKGTERRSVNRALEVTSHRARGGWRATCAYIVCARVYVL